MELKTKSKTAVALIELLIALVMTAVLMLMLFGIVTKKAKNGLSHQEGIFYCWKDWDGSLYQKTTTESIQQVSNCKIKIPKDAKNIQVFMIGGGSGGYKFNTTNINNILKTNYTSTYVTAFSCLTPKGDKTSGIYTKMHTSGGDNYKVMTSCTKREPKTPADCDDNIKLDTNEDYTSINNLLTEPSGNIPFLKSFFKDLFFKGHCKIPIYIAKSLKYIKSSSEIAKDNLYYYKGTTTEGICAGYCEELSGQTCAILDKDQGTCYQDGILANQYLNYVPSTDSSSNINKLTYYYINPAISVGTFQESLPGDFKRASAEPGREYTISADSIGDGGAAGNSGGATRFGNLKANGGSFKSSTNLSINFSSQTASISSIADLDKSKSISICSASGVNCNGSISEHLKELATDNGIKVNGTTEIKPAKYDNGDWKYDAAFQNTANDIEKTGFGFFGASAAATDCAIKYYPIKKVKYNDFQSADKESKIDTCAGQGHGMGGAIIIKWD